MKQQYILTCRFYYTNIPLYFTFLFIFIFIYLNVIIVYIHYHPDPIRQSFFIRWLVFGTLLPVILPIPFSMIKSLFVFSKEGIIEHKGYFWGFFITQKVVTPWAGFESWDKSYGYVPTTRESFPEINLYWKPARLFHFFRFNPKAASKFRSNDRPVKWDTFSKHLIEIFEEVNLPNMKPEVEKKRISVAQNLLIGTAALLLIMIVVAGVLSLILGRINWYSAFVISGVVAIVGAIFLRKK